MNIKQLAELLVGIPSVSGEEQEVCEKLLELAAERGWSGQRLPLDDSRFNVYLPFSDTPGVVFSTHLDTVPPDSPGQEFREEDGRLYGRGVLDAKGVAACMMLAAERLQSKGENDFALLFVCGEEVDGAGAKKASQHFAANTFKYLINGEPTENTLSIAQKGILGGTVSFRGKACHSAYPELGEDANRKLIDCCAKLLAADLPDSDSLGKASVNIGVLRGGLASNVISPAASFAFTIRTVSESTQIEKQLLNSIVSEVDSEAEIKFEFESAPVDLTHVDGFPTSVFRAGSDIPHFGAIAESYLMLGPGDITLAHTAEESVPIQQLKEAVDAYVRLYEKLAGGDS